MPHLYHHSLATSATVSKGLFFWVWIADIRQVAPSQSSTLMFEIEQLTQQQLQ
jgi:hypothetical protein